jgi:hypothetical protein
LLARLWWTVAEAGYILLSLAWLAVTADLSTFLKLDRQKGQSGETMGDPRRVDLTGELPQRTTTGK